VVHPEADRGDGVEEAAGGSTGDSDDYSPPGSELECTPRAEPGPQDHHALEADVDHAGPFGPDAAQACKEDGDSTPQRGSCGSGRDKVIGLGARQLLGNREDKDEP